MLPHHISEYGRALPNAIVAGSSSSSSQAYMPPPSSPPPDQVSESRGAAMRSQGYSGGASVLVSPAVFPRKRPPISDSSGSPAFPSKLASSSPYGDLQSHGQHATNFTSPSLSSTFSRAQAQGRQEQRHRRSQRAAVYDCQTTSSNNWTDEFRQRSQQPQVQLSDDPESSSDLPLGPEASSH
ncbi:unnamed protein product [Mortierella alpina]